jgi:hypothetical protein
MGRRAGYPRFHRRQIRWMETTLNGLWARRCKRTGAMLQTKRELARPGDGAPMLELVPSSCASIGTFLKRCDQRGLVATAGSWTARIRFGFSRLLASYQHTAHKHQAMYHPRSEVSAEAPRSRSPRILGQQQRNKTDGDEGSERGARTFAELTAEKYKIWRIAAHKSGDRRKAIAIASIA